MFTKKSKQQEIVLDENVLTEQEIEVNKDCFRREYHLKSSRSLIEEIRQLHKDCCLRVDLVMNLARLKLAIKELEKRGVTVDVGFLIF